MPDRSPPLDGRLLQRADHALPVLALLAVWVLVLYRQALTLGVLSDGWVLLEIASRGLLRAPLALLGYHTIPVTHLFNALLWKLFHLHETPYQLVNLAEMGLVGWLTYRLGCTLFGRPRIGLLAALLFLANSSFYEVPFWSMVGNFQSLAAMFYLGGIFAVDRALRTPRPAGWAVLFALCVLAGFFTYEPAVSLLPVGLLQAVLMPAANEETPKGISGLVRRLRPFFGPAGIVALVVGVSKALTSAAGHSAMFLPKTLAELDFRIYLLVRGCIAIFTLRGSDPKLYSLLSFGLAPGSGTPLHRLLVALWAVALATAAALLAWRSRTPAVRFLMAWFAVHMLIVSTASGIVSRMFYLGAIPAALLSSWLIWRGAEMAAAALGRRLALPSTEGVTVGLAFFALALLVSGATTDLDAAARVHREATVASRRTVELARAGLAAGAGKAGRLVLVNFPAILARDGIGAFAFVNGLTEELALKTGSAVSQPWLAHTYASAPEGRFANGSQPISLAELGRLSAEPQTEVILFDAQERTPRELDRTTWRLPAEYTAASAPYLDWQPGAWPWLRVYAGQPLELPFAIRDDSHWVAIKYLRDAQTDFAVQTGGLLPVPVLGRPGVSPSWPTAILPLSSGAGAAIVTLQPRSEVWLAGVWSFSPPPAYTPESAPFLSWIVRPSPVFTVEAPIDLPLAPCPRSACAIRLAVLAEPGRDLAAGVAGGPAQILRFDDVKTPEWRTATLAVSDSGRPAVVHLEPRGRLAAKVRFLAWAP
ncbi:MAG TPA: hypothetical protein VIA62_13020 [Thermoanaerobaculia bacterium]|jgi:hypothetical protein|nr:hypothetical protein [Thermoanaerobaculia bacterium]